MPTPTTSFPDNMETALADLLTDGPLCLGQVLVAPSPGGFCLTHREDALLATDTPVLRVYSAPEDALKIARDDETDEYRPLKTAPNLRRGWRLDVADLSALRLALEGFYPGRLGAFLRWRDDRLPATPLRETLGRQTGMYRITQKITDEQANALVGRFCRSDSGCLRVILWRLQAPSDQPPATLPPEKFDPAHDQTGQATSAKFLPLFCQEVCNLLVAEARSVVKGKKATE